MLIMFNKQFLPTIEDIENKEAKKLAQNLKEKSIRSTLTNIVDWQERNLQYWIDRSDMFFLLWCLLLVSLCFLPIQINLKLFLIGILLLLALFDIAYVLTYILPLIGSLIVAFTFILSHNFSVANKVLPISQLVALSVTFGAIISLLIYLIYKYRNIKSARPEFKVGDTFKLSLPVDKILKYRLAICRDYAKLTATLLLNLYSKNKIYFILIPLHVATAIKIRNKLYVLDQRLPILTLEKWLMFWKEKMSKNKFFCVLSYIRRNFGEGEAEIYEIRPAQKNISTKKIESKRLPATKIPNVDTVNLTNKLAKMLEIKQISRKRRPSLKIPLEDYAMLYDKDKITEFSLIRAIKNKLENELCGNLSKISNIEITQKKKDLILKIYTK